MAKVVIENIVKEYDKGQVAVNNVNLTINDKEFVVLVGPSGCGKSTTLRMVAGLESITSGNLYIDDLKVNNVAPKDRGIAMVFQNYALYPHMTVYQNMAFGLKIKKVPKAEIHKKIIETAKTLELEDLLDKKPGHMSGGQRQRVAIGRAIVRKPKVFLFDEPLSNLDAKLRGQMRVEIAKLHQKLEATIIYVTHDQVEAMTLGNRIAVLNKGCLEQFDTPMNLYNNPVNMFVAGFIGSPPMNFIAGKIIVEDDKRYFVNDAGNVKFDLNRTLFSIPKEYDNDNDNVTLGIRPEDITISKPENGVSVEVSIETIELLGNEQLVAFTLNNKTLICRLPSNEQYLAQQKLMLYIDLERILLFDSNTEKRVG